MYDLDRHRPAAKDGEREHGKWPPAVERDAPGGAVDQRRTNIPGEAPWGPGATGTATWTGVALGDVQRRIPGLRERTPIGAFTLFDVGPGGVRTEQRAPADYGLAPCTPGELAGADAAHNARELRRVLAGERREAHDAHRDALLLGAALALEVTGRASGPRAGIEQAAAAIDEGAGLALLMGLERFGRDEALRVHST